MASNMQPSLHAGLGHRLMAWCGRLHLPRGWWVYVLVAAALLGASELLWLWHSWPVREILNGESLVVGVTV